MKKVFLGGTCNGSMWREEIIPLLKINYFNPVVKKEAQLEEIKQREECDYLLYVITPKLLNGFYSIAEVVDDSNKRPRKTILVILKKDGPVEFSETEMKHLNAVAKLVQQNGASVYYSLEIAAMVLNDRSY